jgi:hypothetical protein
MATDPLGFPTNLSPSEYMASRANLPTVVGNAPTAVTGTGYNADPQARNYDSTYGGIPGSIGLPPSVFSQITKQIPAFGSMTDQTTHDIMQQLQGILPSDVNQAIQDAGAGWGISSGMGPNSGIGGNKTLRDLGIASLTEQQTGIGNYMNFLSGVGSTMLPPALMADIASRNAAMRSAPIPANAAAKLQELAKGQLGNIAPAAPFHPSSPDMGALSQLMAGVVGAGRGASSSLVRGPLGGGYTANTNYNPMNINPVYGSSGQSEQDLIWNFLMNGDDSALNALFPNQGTIDIGGYNEYGIPYNEIPNNTAIWQGQDGYDYSVYTPPAVDSGLPNWYDTSWMDTSYDSGGWDTSYVDNYYSDAGYDWSDAPAGTTSDANYSYAPSVADSIDYSWLDY